MGKSLIIKDADFSQVSVSKFLYNVPDSVFNYRGSNYVLGNMPFITQYNTYYRGIDLYGIKLNVKVPGKLTIGKCKRPVSGSLADEIVISESFEINTKEIGVQLLNFPKIMKFSDDEYLCLGTASNKANDTLQAVFLNTDDGYNASDLNSEYGSQAFFYMGNGKVIPSGSFLLFDLCTL